MLQHLEAIRYKRGSLEIIDQQLLPNQTRYIKINDTKDAWESIRSMQIRGAPAIASVGCLSLVIELQGTTQDTADHLRAFIIEKLEFLETARPTGENIFKESRNLIDVIDKVLVKQPNMTVEELKHIVLDQVEATLEQDRGDNILVGTYGADAILKLTKGKPATILTHCNTGALATAGYGTALGVIRTLHKRQKLRKVYCTETRPYNQGSRLTTYEVMEENMPSELICDSMAAALMKHHELTAVVLGADRITGNGDVANKIGTYQLAIVAKFHNIPFYVAAPGKEYDTDTEAGDDIVIEERPASEMLEFNGMPNAAPGIAVWNPAFDVTPGDLITGIITKKGLLLPKEMRANFT